MKSQQPDFTNPILEELKKQHKKEVTTLEKRIKDLLKAEIESKALLRDITGVQVNLPYTVRNCYFDSHKSWWTRLKFCFSYLLKKS